MRRVGSSTPLGLTKSGRTSMEQVPLSKTFSTSGELPSKFPVKVRDPSVELPIAYSWRFVVCRGFLAVKV